MPGRLRILLAEDEALAGLAAEDVLREAGHEVALVREARRRSRWPGEAVTDLRMPRLHDPNAIGAVRFAVSVPFAGAGLSTRRRRSDAHFP
jgi:hypothetical protein